MTGNTDNPALCECRQCGKDLGIKDMLNLIMGGPTCDDCVDAMMDRTQGEHSDEPQKTRAAVAAQIGADDEAIRRLARRVRR